MCITVGLNAWQEPVSGCDHRKFKLLFVLEKPGDWKSTRAVLSELTAINARLFAIARQMARRGHHVQVADPGAHPAGAVSLFVLMLVAAARVRHGSF